MTDALRTKSAISSGWKKNMTSVMNAPAIRGYHGSTMTSVVEAFERVPFVRTLAPADRERLLPYARVSTLAPGEGCWAEGQLPEAFAFVVRGRIKLVKAMETGRETMLEMSAAGELLCGSVVFCYASHCCSAISMERGTEVLLLPRREVLELVERNPGAARALVRELTDRGLDMCRRVEELAAGQVEQRIALLLLKLADRSGVLRAGQGLFVPIRLTRQDVADLCGTTVETATRVMSRLRKREVVFSSGRGFVVKNRRVLEDVARARQRSCSR
jgi:CRP-like cAMP-binding protein